MKLLNKLQEFEVPGKKLYLNFSVRVGIIIFTRVL